SLGRPPLPSPGGATAEVPGRERSRLGLRLKRPRRPVKGRIEKVAPAERRDGQQVRTAKGLEGRHVRDDQKGPQDDSVDPKGTRENHQREAEESRGCRGGEN